jgi:hypothetical protein
MATTFPEPSDFKGLSSFSSDGAPEAALVLTILPSISTSNLKTIVLPQVCELPPSSTLTALHFTGSALTAPTIAEKPTTTIGMSIAMSIDVGRILIPLSRLPAGQDCAPLGLQARPMGGGYWISLKGEPSPRAGARRSGGIGILYPPRIFGRRD